MPFSFANGTDGFVADVAEYLLVQDVRFVSEHRRLPQPLDNRFGLLLGGTNLSDDLFMYIYRPVTGLVPGQRYRVRVDITFATNIPPGCFGVGGSPGEGVAVKAGATAAEPTKRVDAEGFVFSSIDKGNQLQSGREMILIGDFSGGGGTHGVCPGEWRSKTLSTADPQRPIHLPPLPPDALLLTADTAGRLWIVIGTDSGYEARTEIYYVEGTATFTPA